METMIMAVPFLIVVIGAARLAFGGSKKKELAHDVDYVRAFSMDDEY